MLKLVQQMALGSVLQLVSKLMQKLMQHVVLGLVLQLVLKLLLTLELTELELLLVLVLWPVPWLPLQGPPLLTFAGVGIPPHHQRAGLGGAVVGGRAA